MSNLLHNPICVLPSIKCKLKYMLYDILKYTGVYYIKLFCVSLIINGKGFDHNVLQRKKQAKELERQAKKEAKERVKQERQQAKELMKTQKERERLLKKVCLLVH